MCWKQAIIIKESTTIKERSDVHWNKCMDAHPAKARLSKKAQGIFCSWKATEGRGEASFPSWQANLAV